MYHHYYKITCFIILSMYQLIERHVCTSHLVWSRYLNLSLRNVRYHFQLFFTQAIFRSGILGWFIEEVKKRINLDWYMIKYVDHACIREIVSVWVFKYMGQLCICIDIKKRNEHKKLHIDIDSHFNSDYIFNTYKYLCLYASLIRYWAFS